MRILAVSQYYWPEPFNVSEVCEELVSRGHEVTVLTGLPNYPEGNVYDGYADAFRRVETRNGVKIVRSWLWPRKRGAVSRFINYESFSLSGTFRAMRLGIGFDVVISFEISPIMSANPAIAYARKYGVPLLLYVIDIWPECLLAGGIKSGSPVYRHYAKVSARIYSAADRLAVTSPLFGDYISKLLKRDVETVYLPQFAEELFLEEAAVTPQGYEGDFVHFTFAGNIGSAQSVQTIVRAAARLLNEPVRFHIVGSGSDAVGCQRLAEDLGATNVIFHGRHALEEMPAYYAASDAMIATFADNPTLGYTLPRKIQSYMAAGKPVLGTLVGEARRVIEDSDCGSSCSAEDADGLAQICRRFLSLHDSRRVELGENARAYYQEHFSRKSFFETLENEITTLKGGMHHE